jgi:hypothetical protein
MGVVFVFVLICVKYDVLIYNESAVCVVVSCARMRVGVLGEGLCCLRCGDACCLPKKGKPISKTTATSASDSAVLSDGVWWNLEKLSFTRFEMTH